MLQKLPNEILVKILEKTKRTTNQNCRLLNSRFDNIIKKFELHKKDVYSIYLYQSKKDDVYPCSITLIIKGTGEHLRTEYNSYSTMMTAVTQLLRYKIRPISRFSLFGIAIDDDIINEKCLRTLSILSMVFCPFNYKSTDKWFSYLSQLRLNDFTVVTTKTAIIPIPETILNNVANSFSYHKFERIEHRELPWMNDSLLEKWFSPEKYFSVANIRTAFTLEGIIRCLKKLRLSEAWDKKFHFNFGLLANATSAQCERSLTDVCGSDWYSTDDTEYKCFRIIASGKYMKFGIPREVPA